MGMVDLSDLVLANNDCVWPQRDIQMLGYRGRRRSTSAQYRTRPKEHAGQQYANGYGRLYTCAGTTNGLRYDRPSK